MTSTRPRRLVAALAVAAIVVVAIVEWVLFLLRPEGGPFAVLQIIAPHLALASLVAVPFALVVRTRGSALAIGALILVVGLRFGGEWISLPAPPPPADSIPLAVATWNLEIESRPGADTAAMLRERPADIIAVQELQPDAAAAIEADRVLTARYPYRALVPRDDVGGMGILSRLPILESTFQLDPILQQATIDLGGGRHLAVVNAHPFHAEIESLGRTRLPVGFDPARRNDDLAAVRGRIDGLIGQGLPVAMLGDLNTAASEPAFDRFTAGLRDVHREVGFGPGWTWRPIRFEFLGIGLIAIDHIVVSPDVVPLSIAGECPSVGDHCLIEATVAVPGRPAADD
jgi:endonuclease/exonuclease/phosphatase family metal-dependent hydrolase